MQHRILHRIQSCGKVGPTAPRPGGSRLADRIADTRMKQTSYTGDPAILSCWKDIARYLGKGVRTVQRWEREFDLPVRRPKGADRKSAVAADPRDLDAWLTSRWSLRADNNKRSDGSDHHAITSEINRRIEAARSLRERHCILVRELSATMQMLSQNCQRLVKGELPLRVQFGAYSRLPKSDFPGVSYLPTLAGPRQRPVSEEPDTGDGLQSISHSRPS